MKDRIVRNIFDKAEESGLLRPGGTVVAASSGNTGAAVAMLAAMRGYKAVITTSPKCSEEKIATIRAYGADIIVSKSGIMKKCCQALSISQSLNLSLSLRDRDRADTIITLYHTTENFLST